MQGGKRRCGKTEPICSSTGDGAGAGPGSCKGGRRLGPCVPQKQEEQRPEAVAGGRPDALEEPRLGAGRLRRQRIGGRGGDIAGCGARRWGRMPCQLPCACQLQIGGAGPGGSESGARQSASLALLQDQGSARVRRGVGSRRGGGRAVFAICSFNSAGGSLFRLAMSAKIRAVPAMRWTCPPGTRGRPACRCQRVRSDSRDPNTDKWGQRARALVRDRQNARERTAGE